MIFKVPPHEYEIGPKKEKKQIGTFQNKANITCQNDIINNSMQGVHWIFNFSICTKNHSIRTNEVASLSS